MRISKRFKFLAVCLIIILAFTACGSKEEKSGGSGSTDKSNTSNSVEDQSGNASKDTEVKDSDQKDEKTPVDDKKSGDTAQDLGDLDSETLKIYPKDSIPSMYYYGAKEIDDTVFYPDQEEILGDPYMFNGTVLEEYDEVKEYINMFRGGDKVSGLDVSSKGYKVMTKTGPVIVVNTVPYNIKYIRDNENQSWLQYDSKCWFSDLKNYMAKDLPKTGDTCRFYGFYGGYSEKDDCPLFTYGVSILARNGFFPNNYLKYRRDEVKKAVYPSRISFEYPVGWSDYYYFNDQIIIYLPNDDGYLYLSSFENSEMSIEDIIKMMTGELSFDMPEDMPEGEDAPQQIDISSMLRVNTKEKVALGDGSIEAYHLDISSKTSSIDWQDETVYIFKAKQRYIVVMEFGVYNKTAYADPEDNTQGSEALESDDQNTSESDENTEKPASGNELEPIYREEFEKVLKTIVYNGY